LVVFGGLFFSEGTITGAVEGSKMKVVKFLQEPLKENLRPLNRAAKRALKEVKVYPDPHRLYCLQLARWALESGEYEPRGDLSLQVGLMLGWEAKSVVRFLEQNSKGEDIDLLDLKPQQKPEELAGVILSEIEDKLSILSGYPPFSKL
jgi:hypothetical protein